LIDMSTQSFIPDVLRRQRQQASTPSDIYTMPHCLPSIIVGIVPIPLTTDRIVCELFIAQATIANGGIIYIGGPEVSLLSGIELDGGRGILIAAGGPPSGAQEDLMRTAAMQGMISGQGAGPSSRVVIPLNQIWVVANLVNQGLRVLYMLPNR
jgi:hypothetical protein